MPSDPISMASLAMGGLGAASQLFKPKAQKPPPLPALAPPPPKTPGATVKLGLEADDTDATKKDLFGRRKPMSSTRSIGGLGRSGLGL